MAIFHLFYKLMLERENMHTIKRFYLLGALVVSLIIPSLVFVEYIEPIQDSINTSPISHQNISVIPADIPSDKKVFDFNLLFWSAYILGIIGFGTRFSINLFYIIKRIKQNPKIKDNLTTKVLLLEKLPPHTFFCYIFLNKSKYLANEIPEEVFLHEETHAVQLHSIDIIFIELLQVFLWFNPLIYFYNNSIKLNHEFLADSSVLKQDINTKTYQNTLLSYFSKNRMNKYQSIKMVNAINYSSIRAERCRSIKKRFTIMKRETSKLSITTRTLLLVPLTTLLLFGFSETKFVEKTEPNSDFTTSKNEFSSIENIQTNRSIEIAGLILDTESLLPIEKVEIYDHKNNLISKTDERGYFKIKIDEYGLGEIHFGLALKKKGYVPQIQKEHWGNLTGEVKSTFYFGLQKKGSELPQFSELITNGHNLSYKGVLKHFPSIKDKVVFNKKLHAAKKGNQLVVITIDNTNYLVNDFGWIKLNSTKDLISINNNKPVPASDLNNVIKRKQITGMTPLKNTNAKYAVYTEGYRPNINRQKGASREQMKEYNALAKKYNDMPQDRMHIKKKEVERLRYIYELMSAKQRKDAEPFPMLPEAPKSPQSPPPPKIPSTGKVKDVPPPPPPKTPVEHIKEMVTKGATFYYEGKEITSDKAMELLGKNKSLNIKTTKTNSGGYRVTISKKPNTLGKIDGSKKYDSLLGISFTELKTPINKTQNQDLVESNFEYFITTAKEKNISFYYKNKSISILKARELLQKHKDSAAIISHLGHPELKRLDIITDIDKNSTEIVSK